MLSEIDAPEPAVLCDVVIGPALPGSSKSQTLFQVFPHPLPLAQIKYSDGELKDTAITSPLPHTSLAELEPIQGPVIYAGPYHRHFGHFVAESMHRLYAKSFFHHLRGARVAFLGNSKGFNPITPWFVEVLDLCGVDRDDIIIVDKPTRFSELHVPVQGRVLGGKALFETYADIFVPRLGPVDTDEAPLVYFSRSKHMFSGSYLGETLVEKVLSEAGFRIVYPEALHASTVVRLIMASRVSLFCEGSAVHNIELCGRVACKVGIISRRPFTHRRFSEMLTDLTGGWAIWGDTARPGVCLDWNPTQNRVSWQRACTFIDIAALVDSVATFTGISIRQPSPSEIQDSVREGLAEYLLDPRSTGAHTSDEKLGALVRDLRLRWGQFQSGTLPSLLGPSIPA